jgi:hypothetical protein
MRFKCIFASIAIFICALQGQAQVKHSVGGGFLYGTGKIPADVEGEYEKPTILGYGIFYHPRYNLTESDNSAISVGFPITFGISGSVNSQTGSSLSITADLPLTIDYNFGGGASSSSEGEGFGGFVGAGFGYTYSNQSTYYEMAGGAGYEHMKGTSYGPLAQAGIRAPIGDKSYFLRVFYKMGLETQKFKTFGLAIGINL